MWIDLCQSVPVKADSLLKRKNRLGLAILSTSQIDHVRLVGMSLYTECFVNANHTQQTTIGKDLSDLELDRHTIEIDLLDVFSDIYGLCQL